MTTNQKQHWNEVHGQRKLEEHSLNPTAFARQVNESIPPASRLLDLGCGVANDSVFFAEQGHTVTATDFSDVVISQNTHKHERPNLTFLVLDIAQPFPYNEHEFDVVYARLSLHYFTDEVTKQIFREIHRVLSPGGLFCFMCKSVHDPRYGQGEIVEKDMFESEGHVRHFFTEEYARECMQGLFHENMVVEEQEELYGRPSAAVKVIAYKEE